MASTDRYGPYDDPIPRVKGVGLVGGEVVVLIDDDVPRELKEEIDELVKAWCFRHGHDGKTALGSKGNYELIRAVKAHLINAVNEGRIYKATWGWHYNLQGNVIAVDFRKKSRKKI